LFSSSATLTFNWAGWPLPACCLLWEWPFLMSPEEGLPYSENNCSFPTKAEFGLQTVGIKGAIMSGEGTSNCREFFCRSHNHCQGHAPLLEPGYHVSNVMASQPVPLFEISTKANFHLFVPIMADNDTLLPKVKRPLGIE